MTHNDNRVTNNTTAFDSVNEIKIGKKIYIVERHFIGGRDYKQAMFSVVENEARRGEIKREPA